MSDRGDPQVHADRLRDQARPDLDTKLDRAALAAADLIEAQALDIEHLRTEVRALSRSDDLKVVVAEAERDRAQTERFAAASALIDARAEREQLLDVIERLRQENTLMRPLIEAVKTWSYGGYRDRTGVTEAIDTYFGANA